MRGKAKAFPPPPAGASDKQPEQGGPEENESRSQTKIRTNPESSFPARRPPQSPGIDGARSGGGSSWGHRGVCAAGAIVVVVADLPGHGLLRRAARHTVPHQGIHAALRRLLFGPLPPAGAEPQLQVRAVRIKSTPTC
jgi:hypothetical protein